MTKQRFCFLQVSDNLLNPVDVNNPADVYFKSIWKNLDDEGYFKPEHCWEIPTWIAELSYCLNYRDNELILHHITREKAERLPDADIYFASVMDCNKEILEKMIRTNPDKLFYLGGYIGFKGFCDTFIGCHNVNWYNSIEHVCNALDLPYRYGTDYSLFKGMKCIPRLTLSNGCLNRCRFCTVPDNIIEVNFCKVIRQVRSIRNLDFELVYINDKTFGQASNYKDLEYLYDIIKEHNPKFRGFTVQTTCRQVGDWDKAGIDLKNLHIVNVEIGVESFNNDILRKYRKPQSTQTIDYAVFILKAMNVNIIPNIIIGLPSENIYTYSNTLKWVDDNKHDFLMLNVTNFVPYAGSDVSDIVNTQPGDLNQTVCTRSYHTEKEAIAVEVFTELLFGIGMEIIEATKKRSR